MVKEDGVLANQRPSLARCAFALHLCIVSHYLVPSGKTIPGATGKLLYFFQGGGGCWDKHSVEALLLRPRRRLSAFLTVPMMTIASADILLSMYYIVPMIYLVAM